MKLDKIYLKGKSQFSDYLSEWAAVRNYAVEQFSDKNDDSDVDGLVIFNENQVVEKDHLDIRAVFDNHQKPVHKIDINGTLMVGVSNLDLWIERNRCNKVLFVGSDALLKNENLERYLQNLK
jgi:hypothetical protein